ncbi:permease [Hymenobacter saemangeumensis]|uniref:Permease n=1 Tax=Hymenobacter saemangeumensis TaxID=1084522 RepID=A0ABP8IRE9_9BACT
MFIGHFGIGLGAKALQPRASLGTLFIATQFVDLLWPNLLLLGLERVEIKPGITAATPLDFVHYPISHSLLMGLVWGLALGLGYWLWKRHLGSAVLVGLCVPSHWLLDLLMHRPDLPLFPGASPLLGLGLWNHPLAGQLVEGLVFAGGLYLYLRRTTARNKTGVWALWGLVAFIVLVHAANMLAPPPGSPTAVAWACQLMWLIMLWAYWADRNRRPRHQVPAPSEPALVVAG